MTRSFCRLILTLALAMLVTGCITTAEQHEVVLLRYAQYADIPR